ncbi:MAG: hypothetical protein ABIL58_15655 [Pseudomonadota bacterium]
MTHAFTGYCRPVLIGSMPLTDHEEAQRLVQSTTPEVPVWAQLPRLAGEGMVEQFLPGMPGLKQETGRYYIDTADEAFGDALVAFYERYLSMEDGALDARSAGFGLDPGVAGGFYVLERALADRSAPLAAIKGQVTGPITFTTGLKDSTGQAIFYDPQLRDVAVKQLAGNARWQVERLSPFGVPVIIFIDEPALAGFGSSEFISMTREAVAAALAEVIATVHGAGGLAGIHVCANTDWSLVLESAVDIVNFDAFAYFDRFILYPDAVRGFLQSGRYLAWGIVPTLDAADILGETVDSLVARFVAGVDRLVALGLNRQQVMRQSLISPSCGVGALSPELALRVLSLTREVSDVLRGMIASS